MSCLCDPGLADSTVERYFVALVEFPFIFVPWDHQVLGNISRCPITRIIQTPAKFARFW